MANNYLKLKNIEKVLDCNDVISNCEKEFFSGIKMVYAPAAILKIKK